METSFSSAWEKRFLYAPILHHFTFKHKTGCTRKKRHRKKVEFNSHKDKSKYIRMNYTVFKGLDKLESGRQLLFYESKGFLSGDKIV